MEIFSTSKAGFTDRFLSLFIPLQWPFHPIRLVIFDTPFIIVSAENSPSHIAEAHKQPSNI